MAVNKGVSIKVEGLKEFQRELKKVDQSAMKDANYKIAQFVTDKAQGRAGGVGRQAAKAAGTLRASRSGIAARVVGGAGIDWFNGAEFGSVKYHQFKAHRGTEGYFLFPTIRDDAEAIADVAMDEFMKVAEKAFPE